ncbi:DUF7521 family protein [Halobellus ordinarius]|uniref:DUF7521 family protein n=1 Tax=Halobellus ordinarius TaxID=3075120 RepID=UPI003CE47747
MTGVIGSLSTLLAAVALAFALGISAVSFRTFRRERTRTHRNAFFGFLFLTVGVLIEEILLVFTRLPLHNIHSVESLLFVVGFGFLYLSLR